MAGDPQLRRERSGNKAAAQGAISASGPTDITTEQFLFVAKEALRLRAKDGRLPCTLLILDEAQQYIGDSQQRASLLTEVTEAVSKQLDSHVMVVAAGQSALTEIQLLTYLLDRFTIRVPLSDAEVETVTRKVLLQKKPTAVADVRALLDKNAGEVSRQLQGTRIARSASRIARSSSTTTPLPAGSSPLLRIVSARSTRPAHSSQLRSQLWIIHDAQWPRSPNVLWAPVVPADDLFEALAPEMVNTGVLLREGASASSRSASPEGAIAQRICGLVFLIGKLPRVAGADIGVRATMDHIGDLLIDDLLRRAMESSGRRSRTNSRSWSDQGILMLVGDEYRLQTRAEASGTASSGTSRPSSTTMTRRSSSNATSCFTARSARRCAPSASSRALPKNRAGF